MHKRKRSPGLPSKQLLTLSVISPDAWMVEAVFADYDLDNLKMETVHDLLLSRHLTGLR